MKVIAHHKPVKTQTITDNTSAVIDWIGGLCPADTLLVWFPAHWAPMVIKALHDREQKFKEDHSPGWMRWIFLQTSGM